MGKVLKYYLAHLDELDDFHRFHFVSRVNNWSRISSDAKPEEFPETSTNFRYESPENLEKIFHNNDYSGVLNVEARAPYFEKYAGLYGLEAALFFVHHNIYEWGTDLRPELLNLISKEKLAELCAALLKDTDAVLTLSTFAVNVIGLTHELFPELVDDDWAKKLLDIAEDAQKDTDWSMFLYLITHIIICDSSFYRKKPSGSYKEGMKACEKIILDYFGEISLDNKLEFLVCARLVGYDAAEIYSKLKKQTSKILSGSPYLIDPLRGEEKNTLVGAEHRNVLYIMAGLDN